MSEIICNGRGCHMILNQIISENSKIAACGREVETIFFLRCTFNGFPSAESIKSHGKNIKNIIIGNSELSRITANDLKGYNFLRYLTIRDCKIEELPHDLFIHTPNLERIDFSNNKIKFIGEGILTPLLCLKNFDLSRNTSINCHYNSDKNDSLEKFVAKLNALEKNELNGLKRKAQRQEIENASLKKRLKTAENVIEELKQKLENFTVKLNEKEFKVQKKVLTSHSKAIARIIEQNPEADSLELRDVDEETFKEIIAFFFAGIQPNVNVDLIKLFAASCKLEADDLSNIVSENLKDKVNPENSLDVLLICNKFDNFEELKMKAFAEFGKNFPHQQLALEFASNPEILKKLGFKLEMDKLLAATNVV